MKRKKKIPNLKNDVKQFRTADFYLPKYKTYIEFFGLWNNTGNDEYRIKKQVYNQNGIPCVYIYPENLGIIDFTFDKRIQIVLRNHQLKDELRSYHFFKLKKSFELRNRIGYFVIAFSLFVYKLIFNNNNIEQYLFISIMGLITAYQTYQIIQIYFDIFKRNKFSLTNL